MANFCVHRLLIEGSKESIDELLAKELLIETDGNCSEIDFTKFCPEPIDRHYGCEASVHRINDPCVLVMFETKWSPAVQVVTEISKRYHDLNITMTYFELGIGFAGLYVIEGTMDVNADKENAPELHEPNVTTDITGSYVNGSLGG